MRMPGHQLEPDDRAQAGAEHPGGMGGDGDEDARHVIGLELVARHPHRVSTLVAFEPSLPTLLDVDAVPAADHADAHVTGDYVIDSVALRASHVAILPAAGRASRGSWTHGAAEVLARRLAWPLIEFQGDGTGYVTRPASFAAQLAETLHGVPPPDGIG